MTRILLSQSHSKNQKKKKKKTPHSKHSTSTTMYLTDIYHLPSIFPSNKKAAINKYHIASNSFDESLSRRLKTLTPPPNVLNFPWLSSAVDFLSFVHAESTALITSHLKPSSIDESLGLYLHGSLKVLDLCNSISSEIERLRHRRILLNFALHLSADDFPDRGKLRKARDSLSGWDTSPALKRSGFGTNLEDLLKDLASGLGNAPLGKISSVEGLVRRTIHALGLVTVFVAGVVAAALRGDPKLLVAVRAPPEFLWADSFNGLDLAVSTELTRRFGSNGRNGVVEELREVEARVRELCRVIDDVAKEETEKNAKERFNGAVKELERATGAFSEGLDRMSNGVNGVFDAVLRTRTQMLGNVRVGQEKQPPGK